MSQELHESLGPDTLVNESRRLSKQIKILTDNFDKEMRKEASKNVNKRRGSNASEGSQHSDLSVKSSISVGIQVDGQDGAGSLNQLSELGSELEAGSLEDKGIVQIKELDSLGNTIEVKLEVEEEQKLQ